MSSCDSELSGEVYTVERIVDVRVLYGGRKEFLIKWENYPESENTWEKQANIIDVQLILDFEKRRDEERERRIAEEGYVKEDTKHKKKVVHKTLTELASSIRKGHNEKLEKELARKRDQLHKKQAEEKLAKARKLQRALEITVSDDDGDHDNKRRHDSSGHRTPKDKGTSSAHPSTSKSSIKRHRSKSPDKRPIRTEHKDKRPITSEKSDVSKNPLQKSAVTVPSPQFVKPTPDKVSTVDKSRVLTDIGVDFLASPSITAPVPVTTGFDKGYKVKDIVGFTLRKKPDGTSAGIQILVLWDNGGLGEEEAELVPMDILRIKEPAKLIKYFEGILIFHSADVVSSDSSSDSSSSDNDISDTDEAPGSLLSL